MRTNDSGEYQMLPRISQRLRLLQTTEDGKIQETNDTKE